MVLVSEKVANDSYATRSTSRLPPRNRAAPPRAYDWLDFVGADVFYIPRFALPKITDKEQRKVLHVMDAGIRWSEADTIGTRSGPATVEKLHEIRDSEDAQNLGKIWASQSSENAQPRKGP